MNKAEITNERKDEIISGLLEEYLTAATEDGIEVLLEAISVEELNAYGYDLADYGYEIED